MSVLNYLTMCAVLSGVSQAQAWEPPAKTPLTGLNASQSLLTTTPPQPAAASGWDFNQPAEQEVTWQHETQYKTKEGHTTMDVGRIGLNKHLNLKVETPVGSSAPTPMRHLEHIGQLGADKTEDKRRVGFEVLY